MPRPARRKRTLADVADLGDPLGFGALASAFLERLRVRNYSKATVDGLEWNLSRFIVWCQERDLLRPSAITKPILDRYQRHLYLYRSENGRPLSFRAQHHRLSAIRLFFKWLTKGNYLLSNPASEIETPKLEKRLPAVNLSVRQIERVLSVPDLTSPLGMRDRAILEVLYATGVRRAELVALKLYDVDLERGTLFVRQGKGKKDRMIPLGERAGRFVERYVESVRGGLVTLPDEGFLFLSRFGTPFTAESMGDHVKKLVRKSDVTKAGSCHLFRHAMATLMLENGADIRYIQAMLGHAELTSTQIYTHVAIGKLKEIHRATHPGMRRTSAGEPASEGLGEGEEAAEGDEPGEEDKC